MGNFASFSGPLASDDSGVEIAKRLRAASSKEQIMVLVEDEPSGYGFSSDLTDFARADGHVILIQPMFLLSGMSDLPLHHMLWPEILKEEVTFFAANETMLSLAHRLFLQLSAPANLAILSTRYAQAKQIRDEMFGKLSSIAARTHVYPVGNLWINMEVFDDHSGNNSKVDMAEDQEQMRPDLSNAALEKFALRFLKVTSSNGRQKPVWQFHVANEKVHERLLQFFNLAKTGDQDGSKNQISRRSEVKRETAETQIAVTLDLDNAGEIDIQTGIGFWDHMLEQIAKHAGISLRLYCHGDLHVDAHHSIEDCALALGTALRKALGDKRGIERFGFVLPMDETRAEVAIDLSGRPFLCFSGEFLTTHIGDYPTEMTEHVFRSLADSMAASIHVSVDGENDHHKTEACFKAFGRALRMGLARPNNKGQNEVPSTKGVLS